MVAARRAFGESDKGVLEIGCLFDSAVLVDSTLVWADLAFGPSAAVRVIWWFKSFFGVPGADLCLALAYTEDF